MYERICTLRQSTTSLYNQKSSKFQLLSSFSFPRLNDSVGWQISQTVPSAWAKGHRVIYANLYWRTRANVQLKCLSTFWSISNSRALLNRSATFFTPARSSYSFSVWILTCTSALFICSISIPLELHLAIHSNDTWGALCKPTRTKRIVLIVPKKTNTIGSHVL